MLTKRQRLVRTAQLVNLALAAALASQRPTWTKMWRSGHSDLGSVRSGMRERPSSSCIFSGSLAPASWQKVW